MAVGDTNLTNLVASGDATIGGALAVTGAVTLTGNSTVAGTLGVTGAATLGSTLAVTGAITATVPIAAASLNAAGIRKIIVIPFQDFAAAALADDVTYTKLIAPGRAGVIKQISIAAITPPVGGTSTVDVLKNNATVCLAAPFDPTGLTTVVASKPALHGTAANYTFTATDTLAVVWTAGTQSTDAIGATVTVELELTDL